MAVFPNPFAGQTTQPAAPVLPRVPWNQNPMVTTAAFGLLGGRTLNEGLANVAQSAPYGLAAKTALQTNMQTRGDAEALKADWNAVLIAKSKGLPPPPDAMGRIAQANPAIGAKLFESISGVGNDASLVPIWGTGPDGKPMLVQPTQNGTAVQTKLPEGFVPSKGIDKIDAGTEWLLMDKQTGQVVGRQPKDVAGQKSLEAQGTAQGGAAANLPMVKAAANRLVSSIDAVLTDPYLPSMTGPIAGRMPNISGSAARAQSKIDQIMGGTFLQAYNDLRGGGQITEKEGEKATAAYNRLSTLTMADADYVDALKEFRAEIINLAKIAEAKASAAPTAPGGSPAPISVEEWLGQNP